MKAQKHWTNEDSPVEVTIHTDQHAAMRIAHCLIAAGLEASVEPQWSVTVPQKDKQRAHGILFDEIERHSKKR